MITACAFGGLMIWLLSRSRSRHELQQKDGESWLLDGLGLIMQGLCIPWVQLAIIMPTLGRLWPQLTHSLHWPPAIGFLVSFGLVDYLYYWNHRWLHSRWAWPLHQVHHTVTTMDVLATSRNTLWSSFFILYVWIHAYFLQALADPSGYLIGVGLSNALDLWRHSEMILPAQLQRWCSPWLILPTDHAWHHSRDRLDVNFGANFKWWDTWHGTAYTAPEPPARLGIDLPLSLSRKLLAPMAAPPPPPSP